MNSFRDMVRIRGAELRIHCRALRKRRRGSRAWNGVTRAPAAMIPAENLTILVKSLPPRSTHAGLRA